jgi:ATP-dependent helicase/nuclease subunit A
MFIDSISRNSEMVTEFTNFSTMAEFKIIRASAGSGKTYSLTEEILKILIKEPINYFKHILAVTFTNKATAEMKSRILHELYLLGSNQSSNHLNTLIQLTHKTEALIRIKAQEILHSILHGYSWFRVETIDTFFQGIIRSFVREIGIAGNYTIELDQDKVLNEAIDRLLDKVGQDKEMLDWLMEHIDTKLADGKSWGISDELLTLGRSLFRESLIAKMPEIQSLLKESDFLKAYRDTLYEIIKSYESRITEKSNQALDKLTKSNFEAQDFSYGKNGPVGYLTKLSLKQFDSSRLNVKKVLESGKWASAKCDRKSEAENIGVNILEPALREIIDLITKDGKDYNSSVIILKNLHIMGLLSRLNDEVSGIREDKGIFLISDAAPFIQKIINENDTPFIYEKAGNQFNHLLIDEFQDTSNLQWDNFKPLISNSLSNNHDCLLVGDVKQSIYRWRNSNWEILESQVKIDFNATIIKETTLDINWRSDNSIIEFNNHFFLNAANILDQQLSDNTGNYILPGTIYKDVKQESPEKNIKDVGYINIKIFEKDDTLQDDVYFESELIKRIKEMLDHNYLPGNIAILVRTKKEGSLMANTIVNANKTGAFKTDVGVISNESLFLSSSPAVKLLISGLQFVNTPDDKLSASGLLANYLHVKGATNNGTINFPAGVFSIEMLNTYISPEFINSCKGLKQESLYIITEKLTLLLGLYDSNAELAYIHSFLDLVFEYTSTEHADLNRFINYWLEEGNSKTISATETSGSIRILTIHKSKGLQFPIVIIPFVNWSIVPKSNEKLWLEPEELPYNKLPFLPVNYSQLLEDSIFKSDFHSENYLTLVDNLNLLYVAFTRAENALIAFTTNESNELKNVSKLLIDSLQLVNANTKNSLAINFNTSENRYTIGKPHRATLQTQEKGDRFMPSIAPTGIIPQVRISGKASEFMNDQTGQKNQAGYGRILHAIMEKCITLEDISMAVQSKVEEGILSQLEGEETTLLLLKALNNKEVSGWFENKYTVLTEADIIAPGGKIKRPDRVMLGKDEAIIVDYKFGEEEEILKHKIQVTDYMRLVNETGIKNVTGFIWYVLKNDVVRV